MVWHSEMKIDDLGFKDLSFFAIRRWRLVLIGCLGLLALSLFAWTMIPRREEPKVDMPALSVVLPYPGASPEDVETQVVKPVEEALYGMQGVEYVVSTAQPDGAAFRMKFQDGVNMDVAAEKVRGKILGKKRDLPIEVKDPEILQESTDLVPQMLVATVGFASDATLSVEAKRLKSVLATVPGVAGIEFKGEQKPAVRVQVDPVRLGQHGLTADQVVRALQAANARIPGGELRVGTLNTLLQVNQTFTDARSVAAVPVGAATDPQGGTQTVCLEDVADVVDATLKPRQRFIYQGKPGVALEIRFRSDADAVATGEAIRAQVAALAKGTPRELATVIVHDQPQWVSKSVNDFATSLVEGVLLVMLVVTLGMGLRPALVVSSVIPLAVGGAVLGLMLLGFCLEIITIGGLIVALGLLVDDAVVVVESIQLMRDKGLDPVRASVFGTSRVFWANNGTTAVAVVSFLPLFFMGEDIGMFIKGLPLAVGLCLVLSLLVAQLVTPWLATFLLRKQSGVADIPEFQPFDRQEDRAVGEHTERNPAMAFLRNLYARITPWVMGHPGLVVATATGLLLCTFALFPVIGFQFFPKSDKPLLTVEVRLPKGTHPGPTLDKVREVLGLIEKEPAVAEGSAVSGGAYPGVLGGGGSVLGTSDGEILVRLKDGLDPERAGRELRHALRNLTGATAFVKEIQQGPPVEHPIVIRLYGEDYGRLRTIAEEIKVRMRQIPGTENIQDSLTDCVPLTRVTLDADRALRHGLDPAQVGQTLRWIHGEDKITEFRRGDELVQVVLEGQATSAAPLRSLEDTPIPTTTGRMIPLREAGHADLAYGFAQLQRRNGHRIVEVTADVDAATLPDKVLDQMKPWLEARTWAPGYGFAFAGEQEELGKSFRNLGLAAIGAMILISILLLLMFDNFLLAGIVVALVPFALIGALTGLAITGHPFGFMAFLGLIALIGVFVNHKIYFIGRMQELLRRGDTLESAILQAGQDRLRPVVLTALTAVLGLVPLTLGGGPMWAAFGWVNIFGLMASIPLSLVLLPAFVMLAHRARARFSRTA